MKPTVSRSFNHRSQRGVVLVIALIALVALSLAGIAMVRSTDTGNVISGNMAFRTAALHTVDTGVEAALIEITSTFAGAPTVPVTTSAGRYFPVITDTAPADGLPDVTWSSVPGTNVQGNTVRWVVERLCSTNVSTADQIKENCAVISQSTGNSNAEPDNAPALNQNPGYRITIRVEGPRNTVAMAQATVSF